MPSEIPTELRNELTDHGVRLLTIANDPDNNTVVMTMSDLKELLSTVDKVRRDLILRTAFHEFRVTKIDRYSGAWR